MVDIYQLNLPHPSADFLNTVEQIVHSTELDHAGKLWLDQQNNTTNSADHLFFNHAQVDQLMQDEFGKFFSMPIGGVVGIMKNTGNTVANHPPHIDRGRSLAINYYISTGGSAVTTTFYDQIDSTNLDQSKNFTYAQMQHWRLGSVQFEKHNWYAYDVCRCHSIEGITDLRYFISILLPDSQYNTHNLITQYPNLINDQIFLYK